MKEWPSVSEGSPEVDYTEFTEEEIEESNRYITNAISIPDSDIRDSHFHNQDLSLDHGRIVMTVLEGLEGPPMVVLTPPASPDQPGMQDPSKDVMGMCHHMR